MWPSSPNHAENERWFQDGGHCWEFQQCDQCFLFCCRLYIEVARGILTLKHPNMPLPTRHVFRHQNLFLCILFTTFYQGFVGAGLMYWNRNCSSKQCAQHALKGLCFTIHRPHCFHESWPYLVKIWWNHCWAKKVHWQNFGEIGPSVVQE